MEAAKQAERARTFELALAEWQKLRALHPDRPDGFIGVGRVLQALRRDEEAESFLRQAVSLFPDDGDLADLFGWAAHHRSDWIEAACRWADLRERFPLRISGYYGGGSTLSLLNKPDEADVVYRAAFARFPVAPHLLEGFARVADRKGDRVEGARRWSALMTLFPDNVQAHIQLASCLREIGQREPAEAILKEAAGRFANVPQFLISLAEMSARQENWSEALKRWDDVATKFHGMFQGYLGAARTLLALGRYADAQNVILPAVRMFPDNIEVAVENARIAHRRRDWPEAISRWENIKERFPAYAYAYAATIATLRDASKLDEAETRAQEARSLFPLDWDISIEWARLPGADRLGEACDRWAIVRDLHPDRVAAYTGSASALSRAGRAEECESVLKSALDRLGPSPELAQALAEEATRRRDWPEAERRWRHFVERFPRASAYVGLATALRDAGKLAEAEHLLREALPQFPGHIELGIQYALVFSRMRDWPRALELWSKLKSQFPRHPGIQSRIDQELIHARQDLGAQSSGSDDGPATAFQIPSILEDQAGSDLATDGLKQLFMRFESIGDTCEFGIVQRRFGAEPISLLRWASTAPDMLVTALDNRFEGVGDAEYTIVAVSHGEYTTRDRRYHMFSHTFTPESAAPQDEFFAQQCRRMQFLRRKLLDDLTQGEKIFVYKSNRGITDKQIFSMYASIKNYGGSAKLMVVRIRDDDHEVGRLDRWDDGLFIGYTDRFSTININIDNWVTLCQKVQTMLDTVLDY